MVDYMADLEKVLVVCTVDKEDMVDTAVDTEDMVDTAVDMVVTEDMEVSLVDTAVDTGVLMADTVLDMADL